MTDENCENEALQKQFDVLEQKRKAESQRLIDKFNHNASSKFRKRRWLVLGQDIKHDIGKVTAFFTDFGSILDNIKFELTRNIKNALDAAQIWSEFEANMDWLSRFEPRGIVQVPAFREELKSCRHSEPTWIKEQEAYQNWESDYPETSNWLWGIGRQGAGKLTFASFFHSQNLDISKSEDAGYVNPDVAT